MNLLIVDTETTDLDHAEVCEMAATLYSTKPRGAIASVSTLLALNGENKAVEINGISNELAWKSQPVFREMIGAIKKLIGHADYAVAFNAEFDRPYWEKLNPEIPWFCAMRDFDWEYHKERFTLIELALWLGIGVGTAHRAGDDVRLLVECFNRCSHFDERLEQAIIRSQSPQIELKAIISYDNRQLAKDAGFQWDGDRRIWIKKVRECDRLGIIDRSSFEVETVAV